MQHTRILDRNLLYVKDAQNYTTVISIQRSLECTACDIIQVFKLLTTPPTMLRGITHNTISDSENLTGLPLTIPGDYKCSVAPSTTVLIGTAHDTLDFNA